MPREYPEQISLKTEDFSWSEIKEILDSASSPKLSSFWMAFSGAANKAIENRELKKGKIFWLLADACSMTLKAESINNPFIPRIGGCNSTAHIDLFKPEEVAFLECIIPLLEDHRLRARIADLVWLIQKPRKIKNALSAIEAYFSHPLETKNGVGESVRSWERGLRLSLLLRTAAEKNLHVAKQNIYEKFENTGIGEKFFGLKLAKLLNLCPFDEAQMEFMKEKLSKIADDGENESDFHLAKEYYEFLFRLSSRNEEEKWNIRTKIAELCAKEGDLKKNDSNLVAGHWYEVALKNYRDIPVSFRDESAEDRMQELHRLMNKANQMATNEMTKFGDERDERDEITSSRNHVAGKKFPEVLIYYVHILKPLKVEEIRKSANDLFSSFMMGRIMTSTHLSSDGRVIARTGGIDIQDPSSKDSEQAYWKEMLQLYTWKLNLCVNSSILPGLRMINLEHRITEEYLRVLCRSSRAVPQNRVGLWAKGLFYGFENDFSAASHLLTPQVENWVRLLLKQNGVKTSTIDSFGIETECGLSTLLEREKAKEILGEDLFFELKALLTDHLGPNLRNNISHGLLETGYGTSLPEIYFWWFCLRLMVTSVAWKKED